MLEVFTGWPALLAAREIWASIPAREAGPVPPHLHICSDAGREVGQWEEGRRYPRWDMCEEWREMRKTISTKPVGLFPRDQPITNLFLPWFNASVGSCQDGWKNHDIKNLLSVKKYDDNLEVCVVYRYLSCYLSWLAMPRSPPLGRYDNSPRSSVWQREKCSRLWIKLDIPITQHNVDCVMWYS